MSLFKPKRKKDCDPNCPYDCKECRREDRWYRALMKAEEKERKKLAREECKRGW